MSVLEYDLIGFHFLMTVTVLKKLQILVITDTHKKCWHLNTNCLIRRCLQFEVKYVENK